MKAVTIIIFLVFVFLTTPAIAGDKTVFIHDISVDTQKTNAVYVPDKVAYIGVNVPSIDNGNVGIEVYESRHINSVTIKSTNAVLLSSADTNWTPIIDNATGQDVVMLDSTYDPAYVDITPFLGGLRNVYIRFTIATAQTTGDTEWYLYVKKN